jgi:hypothetical protein
MDAGNPGRVEFFVRFRPTQRRKHSAAFGGTVLFEQTVTLGESDEEPTVIFGEVLSETVVTEPGPPQRRPSDLTDFFRGPRAGGQDGVRGGGSGTSQARHTPRVRRAIRMVVGGYDVAQVDNLLNRAEYAVATGGELVRARARQELRTTELERRVFGYARHSVHCLVAELGRQLGST